MDYVQKYTFIHENKFNGSKLTLETEAESLSQILTDFTDFLRGAGFQIEGYLDVVSYDEEPEDYSDHYDTSAGGDTGITLDLDLDYDHPEANWGGWEQTSSSLMEEDKISLCPVCKIDNNVMKEHTCFDKNCPKGN